MAASDISEWAVVTAEALIANPSVRLCFQDVLRLFEEPGESFRGLR
ncbi:MAG: hypothetical protein ABIP13_10950 [Tepidiformaceae bacterium]